MNKKLARLLILMLCIGLVGCGSVEGEDVQEVSTLADTEQTTDAEEIDETASISGLESDDPESDKRNQNTATDNETVINEETDDTETDSEPEEPSLPAYEVTELDESMVMYASNAVNVRQGPSTDFEIVGSLKPGRDVTVTGHADTGWYEILYNEEKGFVSNKYLQSEKPEEEPAPQPAEQAALTSEAEPAAENVLASGTEPAVENQPQKPEEVKPVTEVKAVAGVIFVGDSRTVQMQGWVGANNCTWIAENSRGYTWFTEKAIPRIDSCVGNGSKILINLGVNDPGNIQNYLALVNAKAEEWTSKGAAVYYASVNPVWENPYVTEEQVRYFNSQLQNGLSGNVHYIDSHSYLESIGYGLVDGLHYNGETYQNLYAYYMGCM